MPVITLHLPDGSIKPIKVEDLTTLLIPLIQQAWGEYSGTDTIIGLNPEFTKQLIIDDKTTALEVTASERIEHLDLYLTSCHYDTAADSPESDMDLDEPDFIQTPLARLHTPEIEEASSASSAFTITPQNQQQLIIDKFGTDLIQLVGNQLGELLTMLIDLVRSYTPQTDLEIYFETITAFIQVNVADEILKESAQQLILTTQDQILALDKPIPSFPFAASDQLSPADQRTLSIFTKNLGEDIDYYARREIAAILSQQGLPPTEIDAWTAKPTPLRTLDLISPNMQESIAKIINAIVVHGGNQSSHDRDITTHLVTLLIVQQLPNQTAIPQANTAAELPPPSASSYLGFFSSREPGALPAGNTVPTKVTPDPESEPTDQISYTGMEELD